MTLLLAVPELTAQDLWVSVASGTGHDLYDVSFADSLHGWIGGADGTLLQTSDGGENWSPVAPPVVPTDRSRFDFKEVDALSDGTVYLRCDTSMWTGVYRRHPGESAWRLLYERPWHRESNNESVWGMSFSTPNHGVIIAKVLFREALLLYTSDGGSTWETDSFRFHSGKHWQHETSFGGGQIYDVVMADTNDAWVLAHYSDGTYGGRACIDLGLTDRGRATGFGPPCDTIIEFTSAIDSDTAGNAVVAGRYLGWYNGHLATGGLQFTKVACSPANELLAAGEDYDWGSRISHYEIVRLRESSSTWRTSNIGFRPNALEWSSATTAFAIGDSGRIIKLLWPESEEAPPGTGVAVRIAPNPAHGTARVSWSPLDHPSRLSLFDLLGRLVATWELEAQAASHLIDLSGLPFGAMYVRLMTDDGAHTVPMMHMAR